MNNDWKDALASLRGSLQEPKEEEKIEISIEEVKPKYLQPDPLSVVIDRKGRNGKTATIIEGFTIQQEEVEKVAKNLKQKLGVGGSVRDGEILIQGEHREKIKDLLQQLGFRTK